MRIGGGLGLGGVLLVLALSFFTGQDPADLVQGLDPGGGAASQPGPAATDESSRFMRVVLGDTEETWDAIFREMGQRYEPPKLVLFEGATESACGLGQSAMGPFYCPRDRDIYLDLTFFNELAQRFGAPGDFAQAYVLAHEVGHHVQNLIGSTRLQPNGETSNQASVRVELQADCFAGVWGRSAQSTLEITDEDLGEALTAAHAIGDDTLGHSDERKFTHGSSEQRKRWFRRGFESGDPRQCDTFAVRNYREL